MGKSLIGQQQTSQHITTGERDTVNQLFGTLKLMYPNFMRGSDEATMPATKRMWAKLLSRYSPELLATATELLPERYPSFAPTIGEFMAIVTEVNTPKPMERITMTEVCPDCRASRKSQIHAESCK